MPHQVLLLPGDGIGPEIVAEARKIINVLQSDHGLSITLDEAPFGGAGFDAQGHPLPPSTLAKAQAADAILLGAVGGPQYDKLDRHLRPERGLLAIREALGLFANIRPAMLFPELVEASTLKPEVVSGLDIVIVRELTGGMYFGQPRGIEQRDGQRVGFNTMIYSEAEISRIANVAFDIAAKRSGRVCSVDKANVLESSELWREVVIEQASKRADIELEHMYVDNAAMQLVRAPKAFDVILTENLFGDILSDAASMLTGSIGMLPSASLNASAAGLFEPVHGSAPDIAGQSKANPLATILSLAMMLRYSLNEIQLADKVESAVRAVLASGLRTADIADSSAVVTTQQMGDAVAQALQVK